MSDAGMLTSKRYECTSSWVRRMKWEMINIECEINVNSLRYNSLCIQWVDEFLQMLLIFVVYAVNCICLLSRHVMKPEICMLWNLIRIQIIQRLIRPDRAGERHGELIEVIRMEPHLLAYAVDSEYTKNTEMHKHTDTKQQKMKKKRKKVPAHTAAP